MKKGIVSLLSFLLVGCLQTLQMAQTASDYQLCEQVLVYKNTKYYNDELLKRKVNCQQYMPLLLQVKQENERFYNRAFSTQGPQMIVIPTNCVQTPSGTVCR